MLPESCICTIYQEASQQIVVKENALLRRIKWFVMYLKLFCCQKNCFICFIHGNNQLYEAIDRKLIASHLDLSLKKCLKK